MTDRLNLIDTIASNDKFSVFSRALKSSGAAEWLNDIDQFTLFVPTNDAFGKVPDAKMNALLGQPGQADLKAFISYHILPGKVMAANIAGSPSRTSVTGQEISFSDNGGLKVNASGMQARNIEATNGVVHALDTVLTAPAAATPTASAPVAQAALAPVAAAAASTTIS